MHLKLPLSAYTLSIDLPWFILAHALFLSVRGLHAVFAPPHDRKAELGLVYFGLGCAYLFTAYMPYEQNAVLHASVPVRILVALVAAARYALDRDRGRPHTSHSTPVLVAALYDGLGGAILGHWLGNYSGVAPAFSQAS